MRYYLDFDNTVLDTSRFLAHVRTKVPGKPASLGGEELTEALSVLIADGSLVFEPGELSPFLYPDAAQFLRDKENAVTIITFGNRTLQEAKVKSALHGIPRMSIIYTEEVRKGAYLAPHTHLHQGAILADDSPVELALVQEHCPAIQLFEVRRDGASSDGRWPVVQSLSELP